MDNIPCPEWNPREIYYWNNSQLKSWILSNGDIATHNNNKYIIKTRKVLNGNYKVWFEKQKQLLLT